MSQTEEKFEAEEKQMLEMFISMAGLEDEDILGCLTSEKIKPLVDAISELREGVKGPEALKIVNGILCILGIKGLSPRIFEIVFKETAFSKFPDIKQCIDRFRWLCFLEYSDIKFGYEDFVGRGDDALLIAWVHQFSPRKRFTTQTPRIERIEPQYLFALGYLAYSQLHQIGEARKKLGDLLRELIQSGKTKGPNDLKDLAAKRSINEKALRNLCASAAITEAAPLLNWPYGRVDYPYVGPKFGFYSQVLDAARESCTILDKASVDKCRFTGFQNTRCYLSVGTDIYVATSMRDPSDFITNYAFVTSLMEDDSLKRLNLTFFDPTQAYIPERIHKGVLESLMVQQAEVTIYNAQEAETFGKDAEAAISLANGKPVIVYVPRIFAEEVDRAYEREVATNNKKIALEGMKKVYSDLDDLSLGDYEDFLEGLKQKGYVDEEGKHRLSAPEKDKRQAIEYVVDDKFPSLLQQLDDDDIRRALSNKGYNEPPSEGKELHEYCIEKIKLLEARALIFRDIHPLSFQVSPVDAVARGVFITRKAQETAKLIKAIFEGSLEYEIKAIEKKINNEKLKTLLLCDKITNSSVRACPLDGMMRNRLAEIRSILMRK